MPLQQEIRGNLAKLLATENLIVEHRRVSTASFDVDRRVLTLPNWDRASKIVYDMLVGHEVGHALFTPNDDWTDRTDAPKDYVNVIEDARIEKLMKRKYPGLKKSFAGGYRELNDQDFFGIANEDLDSLSLIDRINLHFKCGADAMIPFSIEEKLFVARTDLAETFEEVLQIAADVYEFSKSQKVAETPVQSSPQGSSENGSQQSEGQTETQKSEKGNSQESETGEGEEGQGGEGDDQGKEELEDEGLDYDDHTIGQGGGDHSDHCETQRAFDGNSNDLTNPHVENPIYVELPKKLKTEDYVADWTEIHDWIDSQRAEATNYSYDFADEKYREFRKQSQKEVNYLVKEFECKKSASAYARAAQSKTGVLDTSKLHTYLYNEDLFKKVTVLPDGKNHGMIFLLDWSGSMSREILDTVKQLINLTSFCKKVQIPFEVYAFTNDYYPVRRILNGQVDNYYYSNEDFYTGCEENKIYLQKNMFHLMNVISSRSNGKDYERMCLNLFREAAYYVYSVNYKYTIGMGLSGTPLNEAIVMLNYIIPEFKSQNDLEKVNVCILTDGESSQASYGRKFYNEHKDEYYVRPRRLCNAVVLRDRQTGRTYNELDGYSTNTNVFIQQVRDRFPSVNVLGFRLMPASCLSSFVSNYATQEKYEEVQKQWRKTKSAVIPSPKAFTALYAINSKSLNEDTEFDIESGANKTEISRAFKKMLKGKSTNKKLLSSFVEYVA